MTTVIKIENLWKQYRLGVISHGTLARDLQSWWAKVTGKEDPNVKILKQNTRHEKDLNKIFWALKELNLEVQEGQVLGIVGKNGAGKSTLLKVLSRVTAPTKGMIRVKGRIASLLEVGTGFHPELTGKENIYLNGAILGMKRNEVSRKLDEIIDFSGVEEFIDTPVKRYSSGMYVRLAFAVAAHLEPEILIVDEVLAVGDASFQKKCLGKMGEVSREGRTILFVSHNLGAVANLCDSAILLQEGTIAKRGGVHEIIDCYLEDLVTMQELTHVKNRKGNGIVRFKKVSVYSDTKTGDTKITTGKPLYIELKFIGDSEKLKNGRIDIGIDDLQGNRLLWLTTKQQKQITVANETITFKVERLQLNEGSYFITLYCEIEGNLSDWIKQCYIFSVENIDMINNPSDKQRKPRFLIDYSTV